MIVSISVNGKKVEKDELNKIVIKNEVISRLISKAAKRQREQAEKRKAN